MFRLPFRLSYKVCVLYLHLGVSSCSSSNLKIEFATAEFCCKGKPWTSRILLQNADHLHSVFQVFCSGALFFIFIFLILVKTLVLNASINRHLVELIVIKYTTALAVDRKFTQSLFQIHQAESFTLGSSILVKIWEPNLSSI